MSVLVRSNELFKILYNFDGNCYSDLTPEQMEVQQLARQFSRSEILPAAAHHDKTGEYPWEIIKKAHTLGLMNHHIAEEFGKN